MNPRLCKGLRPIRYHDGICLQKMLAGNLACGCRGLKVTVPRAPLLVYNDVMRWGYGGGEAVFAMYKGRIVLLMANSSEPMKDALAPWFTA